jgi:methylmalonyl-CoA/ethylmalonyl-CoA epimerase
MKGIHHLAIAVESLDEALALWTGTLGFTLHSQEEVLDQRVRVAVLMLGGQRVELMEPLDAESPIAGFLAKRGPGLHHICLEVEGLQQVLTQLDAQGLRLIDKAPRPGAEGRQVAFVHPKATGGVLLELSEPLP